MTVMQTETTGDARTGTGRKEREEELSPAMKTRIITRTAAASRITAVTRTTQEIRTIAARTIREIRIIPAARIIQETRTIAARTIQEIRIIPAARII